MRNGCVFVLVGANCLTPAGLHTQNANPGSPHPHHDPSFDPKDLGLPGNDFKKSRSDLDYIWRLMA